MKFFSRQTNYRLTISPGIPAERVTGKAAIPGKYAKFSDGVVNIPDSDKETIDYLKNHRLCGIDFMPEGEEAPFNIEDRHTEPAHNVQEIVHGSVGKNLNPPSPLSGLKPEQIVVMKAMAKEMAVEMFNQMAAQKGSPVQATPVPADLVPAADPVDPDPTPAQVPETPAPVEQVKSPSDTEQKTADFLGKEQGEGKEEEKEESSAPEAAPAAPAVAPEIPKAETTTSTNDTNDDKQKSKV